MNQKDTLFETYIHEIQQLQLQKDLVAFKEAQRLKKQIVSQKCHQINQIYDKKVHELKVHKKIKQSTFINQMRMKIAKIKYELCEQIFNEVLKRLTSISDQRDVDYQLILINYIVEGCIQMFESDIKIRVLQKDLDMVRILKHDILKSFQYFVQEQIGQQFELNLIIAQNDCLKQRNSLKQLNKNDQNTQSVGGVILTDITGNIVFKNTFDSRLNILKQNAFPMIRQILWEKSLDETASDSAQNSKSI